MYLIWKKLEEAFPRVGDSPHRRGHIRNRNSVEIVRYIRVFWKVTQ